MNAGALVALLEAVYALDLDDQSWMARALTATRELCGSEHTYLGYFYDASDVRAFNVWNVGSVDQPPEVAQAFRSAQLVVGPELLRATLLRQNIGSMRRTAMPHVAPLLAERERVGWGDIFTVNGLDPSGLGCLFTIGTREREFSHSSEESTLYTRIAHHLASAFRCRRLLGISKMPNASALEPNAAAIEAVVDVDGRLVHAEGEAAGKLARERIRSAAQAILALRSPGRKSEAAALDAWHPLVGARWTLVDRFEENGRRYVVARENQARAAGFELLTDRERQVVLQAALGFTNKEIAYALGISGSTVRVLMARAAAKIGVDSRAALLGHPSLKDLGGEPGS